MLEARVANWFIDWDDIPYAIILANLNNCLFDASPRKYRLIYNREPLYTI